MRAIAERVAVNPPAPTLAPALDPVAEPEPVPESCFNRNILLFILKSALKLVLFVLWTVLMLSLMVMVICLSIPFAIASGLFVFSFHILTKLDGIYCILGGVFFPFLMLAGIGLVFVKIWENPRLLTEKCRCLCEWFMEILSRIYSI